MVRLLVALLVLVFCAACGSGDDDDDSNGVSNSPSDCEDSAETIFTECRVALGHTSAETPGLIDDAQDYCHAHSTEVAECLESMLSSNGCDPDWVGYTPDGCCQHQAGCFAD